MGLCLPVVQIRMPSRKVFVTWCKVVTQNLHPRSLFSLVVCMLYSAFQIVFLRSPSVAAATGE